MFSPFKSMSVPIIKWCFWMPRRFDAIALGRWIIVRPKCRDDMRLIQHEEQHIKDQKKVGFWRFCWYYATNKHFRRWAETRAYRVQGFSELAIEEILRELYGC